MSKIKSKGVEKRKFFRLELPLQVTVRILTEEGVPGGIRPLKLKSNNISEQGICLETRQIVVDSVNILSGSPGARENLLNMEIELVPGEEPVVVIGEVCWYDVLRETEEFMYQVGVVFLEFEGHAKERIKLFLKSHKGQESLISKISALFKHD